MTFMRHRVDGSPKTFAHGKISDFQIPCTESFPTAAMPVSAPVEEGDMSRDGFSPHSRMARSMFVGD